MKGRMILDEAGHTLGSHQTKDDSQTGLQDKTPPSPSPTTHTPLLPEATSVPRPPLSTATPCQAALPVFTSVTRATISAAEKQVSLLQ